MPLSPAYLHEHNELILKSVPPEKLLIMELGEGWEPLCRFFDKPIPNEPFPHVNDSKALEGAAKKLLGNLAKVWGAILLAVSLCIFGCCRLVRGWP